MKFDLFTSVAISDFEKINTQIKTNISNILSLEIMLSDANKIPNVENLTTYLQEEILNIKIETINLVLPLYENDSAYIFLDGSLTRENVKNNLIPLPQLDRVFKNILYNFLGDYSLYLERIKNKEKIDILVSQINKIGIYWVMDEKGKVTKITDNSASQVILHILGVTNLYISNSELETIKANKELTQDAIGEQTPTISKLLNQEYSYSSPWYCLFKSADNVPFSADNVPFSYYQIAPASIASKKIERIETADKYSNQGIIHHKPDSSDWVDITTARSGGGGKLEPIPGYALNDLKLDKLVKDNPLLLNKSLSLRNNGRDNEVWLMKGSLRLSVVAKIFFSSFVSEKWYISQKHYSENKLIVQIVKDLNRLGFDKWVKTKHNLTVDLKGKYLNIYNPSTNTWIVVANCVKKMKHTFSIQMFPNECMGISYVWLNQVIHKWLSGLSDDIKISVLAEVVPEKINTTQKLKLKKVAFQLLQKFTTYDRQKEKFKQYYLLDQDKVTKLRIALGVENGVKVNPTDYKQLVRLIGLPDKGRAYSSLDVLEKMFYTKRYKADTPSQDMPVK